MDVSGDELGDFDCFLLYRSLVLYSKEFHLVVADNAMSSKGVNILNEFAAVRTCGMEGIPAGLRLMKVRFLYVICVCNVYVCVICVSVGMRSLPLFRNGFRISCGNDYVIDVGMCVIVFVRSGSYQ